MPITLPVATLLSSAIGGGTAIAGLRSQSKANSQANQTQAQANAAALAAQQEQLAYDRQQAAIQTSRQAALDAEAQREYNQNYGLSQQQFGFNQQQADLAQSNLVNRRDYSRGQFGNYLTRLQPFSQAGQQATANLASVLGRALPASVPTAGSGGGATVRLQSPDGNVRDVPADQAAHYVSMGAVKV